MDRILSAPEPTIRAVLVALCDNDHTRARCHAHLDQLDRHHAATAAPPGATVESPASRYSGSYPGGTPSSDTILFGKRKHLPSPSPCPPQICIQCNTAFAPDSNDNNKSNNKNNLRSCLHHAGHLVINHEADEDREEQPRGFAWTCCGRDGTGTGCVWGEHAAVRGGQCKRVTREGGSGAGQGQYVQREFEGRLLRANEFVNENLWEGGSSTGDDDGVGVVEDEVGYDDDDGDDDGDVASERTERDSGGGESDG